MLPSRFWRRFPDDLWRLFLDVFLQIFRTNLSPVNHALRIRHDALGRAGSTWRGLLRIGNESSYGAILGAPDSHAALPAGMIFVVRFRIGHIHVVLLVDENPARPAELHPHFQKLPVLIEDLDTIVSAIGHEEPSLGIESQRVRYVELAFARAFRSKGLDEFTVLVEFDNPCVRFSAMA